MKEKLKKLVPNLVRNYANKIIKNKLIKNFYRTDYTKRVLISYITSPFKNSSLSHTNYFEAVTASEIFNELGYQVDVVHYEGVCKHLESYDIIYGFGETLEYYFAEKFTEKTKVILYSTGMHQFLQNVNTLQRIKDVYNKKHKWLIKSARLTDKSWFRQIVLSNAVIALGNNLVKKSFQPFYNGEIYQLNAPFYKVRNHDILLENKNKNACSSYVWFGSSGLVHKGLDLCLEYFKKNKDLTLHVCGSLDNEPEFVSVYHKELFETKNIITHGFVNIDSQKFDEIIKSSYFAIFPSCSEGGAASMLTIIGNGAFLPLITKESSVTVPNSIPIDGFTIDLVGKAVLASKNLELDQINFMAKENAKYVIKHNSLNLYKKRLKEILIATVCFQEQHE